MALCRCLHIFLPHCEFFFTVIWEKRKFLRNMSRVGVDNQRHGLILSRVVGNEGGWKEGSVSELCKLKFILFHAWVANPQIPASPSWVFQKAQQDIACMWNRPFQAGVFTATEKRIENIFSLNVVCSLSVHSCSFSVCCFLLLSPMEEWLVVPDCFFFKSFPHICSPLNK